MRLFKSGQEKKVLDLTERYNKQNSESNNSEDARDKRARLVKRLTDMTDKLEELSNQIYKLQQRVEVLERKANIRSE